MAAQSKDGKEKKNKDEVTAIVRRLAEEVAALRTEVAAVKAEAGNSADTSLAAVEHVPLEMYLTELDTEPQRSRLLETDDSTVARFGYALSSAPKIALVRYLLEEGEQSAAQLGEKTGLTTGSLYHHLRELIHTEIIVQSSRNRYALTPQGRRAVLLLFALAQR
jgi:DNA-binding HxlR family transcriptional regulator